MVNRDILIFVMHLKKLDIQGFKTFAKKTELVFLSPTKDSKRITTIVGPNGSGKSNLADAIRWVLGEQSLKLLRGKKSEDIIFSGSEGRGRAGFAEVTLTLDNTDKMMPVDYSEIAITRRLYRDGSSEYLLNDSKVRLADIQLLLAQANVGQRSYSVIGQGMIDHILVSTPEERKAFFDDATGVKQFQIKRHEAVLKMKRTLQNLEDVEMLLREIEPRLRSLKRQAKRLEQREEVETRLHELEGAYYGKFWWKLIDQLKDAKDKFNTAEEEIKRERSELSVLEKEVDAVEKDEPEEDTGLQALQQAYRQVQRKRNQVRDEQFKIEKEIELAKVRQQSNWAPLPLLKIVEEVDDISKGLKLLTGIKLIDKILGSVTGLHKKSESLSNRLRRPNPEDIKPDPKLVARVKNLKGQEQVLAKELVSREVEIDQYAKKEKTVRTELIELQRSLREKQRQIHLLENRRNDLQISLARFEERQQSLTREMNEFLKDRAIAVRETRPAGNDLAEDIYPEIQRLRYKIELIGGIDPEIIQEYEEIKERHEFLDVQVTDLRGAIRSTEKIIKELDEQINKQSEKAFGKINKEFQKYFKVLFNGGSCNLIKVTKDEEVGGIEGEDGVTPERVFADTGEAEREKEDRIAEKLSKHDQHIIGIDIQATPPGKKVKALNLLSGGERALTSIALVSAIMAVNPSPFVVLDEVDAALDEANTMRFASILEDLSTNSQFIIITHNRATMEKGDLLYGVTMSNDGVSNLISVKLEDVASGATARR